MKFLDTNDKMYIVSSDEFVERTLLIEPELLNKSLIEVRNIMINFLKDSTKDIPRDSYIVFNLESTKGVKRRDMINLYNSFISALTKTLCSSNEKFEEHRLFARTEITEQMNCVPAAIITLLNHNCIVRNIQVKATWNNKKIISLV